MAYEAVILEEARKELAGIVDYLTRVLRSPQAAEGFMDELEQQMALIGHDPGISASAKVSELASKGYRVAFVKNYVMLYVVRGKTAYLAHFFHQRQDYARLV